MKSFSRNPRIALVVPEISIHGGIPNIALFLYRILTESGRYIPEVISVATSAYDDCSVRLLSPVSWFRGVRVKHAEWNEQPYRHVGAFLTEIEFQRYRKRRILSRILEDYDLVQIVAGAPAWALVAYDVQRPVCLFTATTVQQERGGLIRQASGWRKLWLQIMTGINARMEQRALSYVSCVFAESNYTRRALTSSVTQQRLLLGVPGVDTSVFYPVSYRPDSYILSVARFADSRKNVRLLFDAYHRLRQAMPQAPRLVLVGETSPTTKDWTYANSLGLSEFIDVHQGVSQKKLRIFFQNASLFVLTSNEEGLGIVILEAMACGIPVISTDCGGPATAIVEGETGCLTPVGDAAAMAAKMQELLAQPALRKSMGEVGKRVVDERFSLEAAGRIYLDKYDELLATS
jgi:glycosyltransferase involved in cell wall biosynthesis